MKPTIAEAGEQEPDELKRHAVLGPQRQEQLKCGDARKSCYVASRCEKPALRTCVLPTKTFLVIAVPKNGVRDGTRNTILCRAILLSRCVGHHIVLDLALTGEILAGRNAEPIEKSIDKFRTKVWEHI
jgi:hypothetical protein